MRLLKYTTIFSLLFIISIGIIGTSAQNTVQDLDLVIQLFQNPSVLLIFFVELLLGIGLGFFSTKILKYVLAIVGILAIGILLNLWQSGSIIRTIQDQVPIGLTQLYSIVVSVIYAIGLTTVLPLSVGFILGIIIALFK
jgi:hypothetical protein